MLGEDLESSALRLQSGLVEYEETFPASRGHVGSAETLLIFVLNTGAMILLRSLLLYGVCFLILFSTTISSGVHMQSGLFNKERKKVVEKKRKKQKKLDGLLFIIINVNFI